jgi:signal transduction histidine kinase
MRRISQRNLWYLTGFTLTALVFIAIAITHFTSSYAASMHWVSHSHQVETAIEELRSDLHSAQNGRLHYVFSHEAQALQQYREAAEDLPASVARLRALTADTPSQQSLVAELIPLIDKQLKLLRTSVEMANQGGSLELQEEFSRTGHDLATDAFVKLAALRSEEGKVLSMRRVVSEKTYRAQKAALFLSFGLVLVVTILNFTELMVQLRERQNAEQVVRRLSGRILHVQDEERRKLARDLHDGIGQLFTALKMGLNHAARSDAESPKDSKIFAECLQIVDEGLSQTRTLSYLLHPPMLDEVGFPAAARWLVDGFSERSKIDVTVEIPRDLKLPRELELTLFRVLQEGLTNIHRHSGSAKAEVVVTATPDAVIMTIRDYGKGIPEGTLQNFRTSKAPAGVGLAGMRGRVAEVDGTLDLESPGHGTVVRVTVPLANAPQTVASPHPPSLDTAPSAENPEHDHVKPADSDSCAEDDIASADRLSGSTTDRLK